MTSAKATATTAAPSPCIAICRMNQATGLCTGCGRSIDEIANWSALPDSEKWHILQRIGITQEATPS